MATVAQNIVTNLRKGASVESAEFGDECFEQWTQEAISEHNAAYLVDGSDLPSKEFSLIQLLVWAKLCESRASIAATQMNVRGAAGYGTDRNTPYYMNTDLATKLRRQYSTLCVQMGIAGASDDVNTVVVGRLSVIDSTIGARTPYIMDQTPIVASRLTLISKSVTGCKIQWTPSKDDTVTEYYIFGRSNATILEPSNVEPTHGVVGINDSATKLLTIYDPRLNAREFTGMTTAVPYHFVVVTQNRQGRLSYSNELTVTPSA
jgi:hypothetical protein